MDMHMHMHVYSVINPASNLPTGDCFYHPFMVILGMVYFWFTTEYIYIYIDIRIEQISCLVYLYLSHLHLYLCIYV